MQLQLLKLLILKLKMILSLNHCCFQCVIGFQMLSSLC